MASFKKVLAAGSLPLPFLIVLLVCLGSPGPAQGAQQRRCFSCRSRGALGDCRDPFYLSPNSTLVGSRLDGGVKVLPCASGWCKKVVGGNGQPGPGSSSLGGSSGLSKDRMVPTERGCLTRGPSDEKPRCFEHQSGEMCICKGDLCNSGPPFPWGPSVALLGLNLMMVLLHQGSAGLVDR